MLARERGAGCVEEGGAGTPDYPLRLLRRMVDEGTPVPLSCVRVSWKGGGRCAVADLHTL